MTAKISEIEEKIISILSESSISDYCNSFDTYDGDTELGINLEKLETLKGGLPACLVSYVKDSFSDATFGGTYMVEADIGVVVVANSVRDEEALIGVHRMLADVKNALHLKELGDEYPLPLVLKERAPLVISQGLVVYEILFQLQFID